MLTFLLVVHSLIAAALVGVILMQKSEGGGISGGGSPTGLMSARGAADFLTRTTAILAALFVGMAIFIAAYSTISKRPRELDETLKRSTPAAPVGAPLAGGGEPVTSTATAGTPEASPSVTSEPAAAAAKPTAETGRIEKPVVVQDVKPVRKVEAVVKQVAREAAPKPAIPKPATPKPVEVKPAVAPAPSAPAGEAAPAAPTP